MLLIKFIHTFFPAHKEAHIFQKEFLLNVQNAYALVILAFLMTQLCNCLMHNQCLNLVTTPQKLIYYFVADTLLCDPTMYLHHIASFVMAYIYSSNIEIMKQSYHLTFGLGIVEISTIFLTFRAILKNYKRSHPYITMFYNINDKIFVITFFYTRVYLYWKLFDNHNVNQVTIQLSSLEYHIFNACLYLLYFLNLYWGYKILQMFIKPLFLRIGA